MTNTKEIKDLTLKMFTYIRKQSECEKPEQVSMDYLMERGKKTHDVHVVFQAITALNKMSFVHRIVRGEDVFYSFRVAYPEKKEVAYSIPQTPEDIQACTDFWEHSPLVSDKERACYHINWESEECEELSMNSHEKRYRDMQKYGARAKVIRERKALEEVLGV